MKDLLKNVKSSSKTLLSLTPSQKNQCLFDMADGLMANQNAILKANSEDMQKAKKENLSYAMLERLMLNEDRICDMANSIRQIAKLEEPVGRVLDGWVSEDDLRIEKVSVPIGVIAIIYESRPNVTSDAAALCFKSSNACVLKGGKEAFFSNLTIAEILQNALLKNKIPKDCISLVPDSSRESAKKLILMDEYIDLIIPRGGEALVKFISQNSRIPIIKHDKGLCHIFLDKSANLKKAKAIVLNAKCQRSGVCNAMETLLVHEKLAPRVLPDLKLLFDNAKTELRGCDETRKIIDIIPALESDFDTEYLDNILSIKIVKSIDEAIEHIRKHSSSHSESIISESYTNIEKFLNEVDSACVYANASTRFTDGAKFGFGAEIGISTNKLHARGPVGLRELTTYKYKIYADGQIRN